MTTLHQVVLSPQAGGGSDAGFGVSHAVKRSAQSCLDDMSQRLRRLRERTNASPLPLEGTSCHYAAILNSRTQQVMETAFNKAGTRSKWLGSSRFTVHAELAVLIKLGDMSRLAGCVLVVTRFNSRGDIVGSKPCRECQTKLSRIMHKYHLQGGTLHGLTRKRAPRPRPRRRPVRRRGP